jgi:hypothetical protein
VHFFGLFLFITENARSKKKKFLEVFLTKILYQLLVTCPVHFNRFFYLSALKKSVVDDVYETVTL